MRIVAANTATASANKIHDDEVARRYGFRGGLVPGVDVYEYLTRPVVAAWGDAWSATGRIEARFREPVYDGDEVEVDFVDGGGPVELRNASGTICATAEVALGDVPPPRTWPAAEQREAPLQPASPSTLAVGTALALRAQPPPVADPSWIPRLANHVLSFNVALGPWIHVGSFVQHHRRLLVGEQVETRAVVAAEWERKGHRFVTLDVGLLAGDDVVAQVEHTAIYAPRGSSIIAPAPGGAWGTG